MKTDIQEELNANLLGATFLSPAARDCPELRCLESRFAVRSDSNRHRFAAISNPTIRIARPKPFESLSRLYYLSPLIGDGRGTTKKLCDKDLAERSGELSGAICLKTLVLLGNHPGNDG